MMEQGSQTLRELIRVLIRNLGVLEKGDASCCGVTITQCHAIAEIGRKEKISLIDLADLLCVDKSTMSRTIDNLVEAELALRDLDQENRRYVTIQLTEDGQNVFRNIEDSMAAYFSSILEEIPEEKREQVFESLRLLTEAAQKIKCC
jgi:DNA-binding MarR family transcriptional regulator